MAESFSSRLPPASADTMFGPEVLPSLGTGASAAVPVAPINLDTLRPIDPNARASLGGFGEVTTEDAGGAKLIDLTAREKLSGAEFDDAPADAEPGGEFDTVDIFDSDTVSDLNKNRENFDPVSYLSANPDVANSPARLKKLLDIRRLRDEEGLTAKGVIKAAKKGGPELAKAFVPAAKQAMENIVDVTVQPIVNFTLGALTGDLQNAQTRKALFAGPKKSLGELSGAAEGQATGMIDLARQGSRKVEDINREGGGKAFPGRFSPPTSSPAPPKPKTDQQLLAEMSDDVEFRRNAADIVGGSGEGAKLVRLDAETLAKEGITLDPKAIEAISLVEPLTMVASAGVFKILGAAGKLIATARSIDAAEKFVDGLTKYAKTAGALKLTGKGIRGIGRGLAGRDPTNIAIGHAMASGDISGILIAGGAKQVAAPLAKKAGGALVEAGEVLAGELPAAEASAGVNRLVSMSKAGANVAEASTEAAKNVFGGAVKGAVASSPFALAATDDEQAGNTLGAGIVFGAGAGVAETGGQAFRAVKTGASRELFGPNRTPIQDVPSLDYGRLPELDEAHKVQVGKLAPNNRADLNNFREALRSQGGEIYAVDKEMFRKKMADEYKARTGNDIDPATLDDYERHFAFFDETVAGKKVVYLNSDTTGLRHDGGHIFDALLSPEKQAELTAAIKDAFTPEEIKAFKDKYDKDAKKNISDDAVMSEYRAELFGALFNNVPVTELAAPKSVLSKFADIAAKAASALEIDLTGGTKTPSLGAPQTVGLRRMFESAARSVLEKGKELAPKPAQPPVPPVIADYVAPTPPVPDVTPTPTSPIAGTTAPNIRVTKAQQDSFSHRNAETGVARARELAASDPVVAARVEEISASLEQGNPVLEIEHLGIVSEQPAAGRRTRVGEQEAGYAELERLRVQNRAEAPASVVAAHSKTFVPVRWDAGKSGTPALIAVSLDKTISNIHKVAKESVGKGVEDLIPYKIGEDGKFTADSWDKIIKDNQAYGENHANGYRGDGKKLTRPGVDVGLSIPAENPNYVPTILSDDVMNFQNLIQGLNTPFTAREVRGQVAGNIKGQIVAEVNNRTLLEPASIRPRDASKQSFASFPGRTVKEVNPLRNALVAKGVDIDKLIPVTERLRAKDIVSVKSRPELGFKAPVTDIVRGGFLPAPTEFRSKNLQGRTVSEFSEYILNASPEEWKAATENMTGGLTGGAWNLGLGLKDAADLGVLKTYQEKLSTATKEAMQAGNFDAAYSLVSKGQFFRESYEAGSGTGSAGAAFKRNVMGTEGVKVPFPQEQKK